MKKFLITISPLCAILFATMWFPWGLKGAFLFFGASTIIVVAAILLAKWVEFVEKHFND